VTVRTAAILLAAGQSRRMGRCKQLLPLGGFTVIDRCLDNLVMGGADEVVVVVQDEGSDVAVAARAHPVRIVVNRESDGDMASSVRAGRDALSTSISGVIVALCDFPLVSAATVTSLLEEHADYSGSIIIPCHGGRRGHPLLFPRPVLDELAGGLILRDLVQRNPERIRCLDVNDPGVLIDMDTPEDYHRICTMIDTDLHLERMNMI
jgi:molybdenum cofactor cytidylyltransferase